MGKLMGHGGQHSKLPVVLRVRLRGVVEAIIKSGRNIALEVDVEPDLVPGLDEAVEGVKDHDVLLEVVSHHSEIPGLRILCPTPHHDTAQLPDVNTVHVN